MPKPEIDIVVNVDSKRAVDDLKKIQKELSRLTPEQEFRGGVPAMQDELLGLAEQYRELVVQAEKVTASYRAEYAALDESAQGYAAKKKELESFILQGETLEKTLLSNQAAVEKQLSALDKLSAKAGKMGFEKANAKLTEYGRSLTQMAQGYEVSEQKLSNYAEAYQNKLLKAEEKSLTRGKKIQAQLNVQSKTYEELIQLYLQLSDARKQAATTEELADIDVQLQEVRKQITLTGREARLSGAKLIGSQTSMQGVFRTTISLWRKGTLTLKGLTKGLQMFAKSTFFLAAIQLAWELLVALWEKGKEALFGSADAAEKAKEKQEELARAAKEASDALLDSQTALAEARREDARRKDAEEFKKSIAAQNEEYKRQIELVNEATAAQLRQLAITAKDDEKQYALSKLQLQQELMAGLVNEFEYQERLMTIEREAAQKRDQNKVQQKEVAAAAAREKLRTADKRLTAAQNEKLMDNSGFELSKEEVAVRLNRHAEVIATFREKETSRGKLEEDLASYEEQLEKLNQEVNAGRLPADALMELKRRNEKFLFPAIDETKKKLAEINQLQAEAESIYNDIPQYAREHGLESYGSNKKFIDDYNKGVQTRQDTAAKEVEKMELALRRALTERDNAAGDAAQAAADAAEIDAARLALLKEQYEQQRKNKANEKRVEEERSRVREMEFSVLKKRAAELQSEAQTAGENTPEGKRRQKVAEVYSAELTRRRTAAQEAKRRVVAESVDIDGNQPQGQAAKVVDLAGRVAARSVRQQEVDLANAIKVLQGALNTKSKADDGSAAQMYQVVSRLVTSTQQSSSKYRELERKYEQLRNKMSRSAD